MLWSLQILRFVAALMVAYLHAAQLAKISTGSNGFLPVQLQMTGQAGVDIFFVISGFIIARSSADLDWRAFVGKRLRRVMPLYALVTVLAFVTLTTRNGSFGMDWRQVIATFFLWPVTDRFVEPILSVAWTLCFEMLFYAAFALYLFRRWLAFVLMAVFGASVLLREHAAIFQFIGNPIIVEFLFGVLIARLPVKSFAPYLIAPGFFLLVLAAYAGLAPIGDGLEYLRGEGAALRVIVYGIPAALITYGFLGLKSKPGFWTEQGSASYALYLTHSVTMPVVALLCTKLALPADIFIVCCVAACALFAWRVHLAIELPILAMLSKRRTTAAT
jgi:exopolysaccharide production protein ExoZ